ncbi:MAG: sigma-70 family RNA polymerase sigma factor [Gemmatimonadota bacterium]
MRALFDRLYPRLVRYLEARVHDADRAEDLAQEAFLRLLEHRPRHPRAWLFRVAENLVRDEARLARGRARHLTLLGAERAAERDPGPEADLLRRQEAERAGRALAELPERDRALLLLHHEGFRYREIAAQLGLAPSSIGPLLTRAQRRLVAAYHGGKEGDARASSL